ncbi:pleckstrin homology domain-containing family G member 3 [Emydura macquarii macquarii]|uniref:pleckstrin homology domain-containing family G member 3 n=1 Tax=Emydura macquarii macquarii TaxID=1129001 RepID=UPI00352A2374
MTLISPVFLMVDWQVSPVFFRGNFWNQILTSVSVRLRELENSARSAMDRYCFCQNFLSSAGSCEVLEGVRGLAIVGTNVEAHGAESTQLPAAPCPDSDDRMPVRTAAGTRTPEHPVSQTHMEGRDKAAGHAPAWEGDALRVNQLHNSNNNASPGGWLARKGSRSLSPFGTRAPAGANHKQSYLERVVLELVETERKYVQDLRSIVEDYLGKIIDTEELLLEPEQVSALFGNIEDIYELNSELLQDLDSCDSDPVAMARCFVTRSQDFDIYTQYCNNYPNSVAALTECMRNKHQAKFFRERQEQIGHALPLGSYLLKPVQRILKYHLLLQEIAKHFDLEEAGYEVVEEAIDTMTSVAWYINDMKRKHEHAVRLQEIQSLLLHWKGPDLTTFGELVLEGTFRVHRMRNERAFFLFHRTLLITKRRGDHFVYKSHIPCSSLMLIESTRDSLCFSVTHYKHSKQQYSIQAKSVEEKRVWTHHIKRLILENHHVIIPQKAKEAILEMDPTHPARYRYSPERLKKAKSCQPMDEAPARARQGRRQSEPFHSRHRVEKLQGGLCGGMGSGCAARRKSEPTKQIVKQLGERAGLKHADSTGTLLEARAPLLPPGSTWQPAEAQGGAEEVEEETLGKEEERALGTGSLEELAVSDSSEKEAGLEEEEEGPAGEEQVADFASSLLAALHGWHCRANALLFSWGRTVRCLSNPLLHAGLAHGSGLPAPPPPALLCLPPAAWHGTDPHSAPPGRVGAYGVATVTPSMLSHPLTPSNPTHAGSRRGWSVRGGPLSRPVSPAGKLVRFPWSATTTCSRSEQCWVSAGSTDVRPCLGPTLGPAIGSRSTALGKGQRAAEGHKGCMMPSSQEPGSYEKRHSTETTSDILEAGAALEPGALHEEERPEEPPEAASTPEPAPRGEVEQERSPSLAALENAEDLKALSSEEEEDEDAGARSILPPSVLNQASVIAELFVSSFSRRSSVALEEGRPGGFVTPRLVSRSSSVLSLEGSEKGQGRSSTTGSRGCVSPPEAVGEGGGPGPGSSSRSGAGSPSPAEAEGTACRRKESMLSQRDRLLLDKIKSYYECAEHRDAGFSIRRRESLSYIPQGLVRSSVCRINSLPHPLPDPDASRRAGGSRTAAWVLSGLPTATGHRAAPLGRAELSTPVADEEFRPPSEMIKVWEGMEKLSGGKACPERGREEAGGTGDPATTEWPLGRSQENGLDLHEPLLILEDDELSAIMEESAVPSPESRSPTERAGPPRLARELSRGQRGLPATPHSGVLPLTQAAEAELSERLKNKVFQLARQYSLRIKNRQPAGPRRLAKLEEVRSFAEPPLHDGQQEVKRGTGPWKPVPSLVGYEQVVLQEYSPRIPLSAASSRDKSPKRFSFSPSCPTSPGSCASSSPRPASPGPSSHSPLSPIVAETFSWPDVRELRSRYSFSTAASRLHRPPPVNRSRSAPEKMVEELPGGLQAKEGWSGPEGERSRLEQSHERGCIAEGSPDPSTRKRQRNHSTGVLCVTAKALLDNQQVLILEKVPGAPKELLDAASYVQIRSPTSRERISLKAVVERCKAYQESDEYRWREEGPAPEPSQATGREEAAASQRGRVRDLREKFQTLNSAS